MHLFLRRLAMRCLRSLFFALAMLAVWVPSTQAQPAVGTLFITDGTFLYASSVGGGAPGVVGQLDTAIYHIAWHGSTLYGLSSSGFLYSLNPATGSGTFIGDTGIL